MNSIRNYCKQIRTYTETKAINETGTRKEEQQNKTNIKIRVFGNRDVMSITSGILVGDFLICGINGRLEESWGKLFDFFTQLH